MVHVLRCLPGLLNTVVYEVSRDDFRTIDCGIVVTIKTPWDEPNDRACSTWGPYACELDQSASTLSGDEQVVHFTFYRTSPPA